MAKLKKEFEFYLENQDEFVSKYNGKYIVIKGHRVLGTYDDIVVAVNETSNTHELGTFLVQLVTPGEDAYTATFHSRVRIP